MASEQEQIVFTCPCGVALAVPPKLAGRQVSCYACGAVSVVPAAPQTVQREPVTAAPVAPATPVGSVAGSLCCLCQTEITATEQAVVCSSCDSPFHQECWNEVGGCGTYGCEQMPQTMKEQSAQVTGGGSWGEVKECPRCHKQIRSPAVKCRFCKARFPSAVPMTQREYLQWKRRKRQLKPVRDTAVGLFLFSLFGFAAPLILPIGLFWLWRSRAALHRLGGFYPVFAYFSLVLSAIYCMVLIVAML